MIRYVIPREKPINAFELFSKNPIQLTKYQLILFYFCAFLPLKINRYCKNKTHKRIHHGNPLFPCKSADVFRKNHRIRKFPVKFQIKAFHE